MKAQHTPGPWEAKTLNRDLLIQVRDDSKLFPPMIATVSRWNDDSQEVREEAEANARLIAAAPRMLAMCQNALEALEGLSEANTCMSEFERQCIPALRAAIAEATGSEAGK